MSPSRRLVVVHDARARPRPVEDLVRLAARELGLDAPLGLVRHHCPTCGSSDHGRPSLGSVRGGEVLHLSIARCPGRSVVALTDAGAIGVDVEPAGAALPRDVDAVLGAGPAGDATRRWVRAEALSKATGRGLGHRAETDRVVEPVWTAELDLGAGYEAALAVVTASTVPEVRMVTAGVGAPSG